MLDTGFAGGSEFGDSVIATLDATDPRSAISDNNGHGTQMAMIASGYVEPYGNSIDANDSLTPVIAVKTFDKDGYSTNFDLMRSIEFAVNKGARVINLSWGSQNDSRFLRDAIRTAAKNDVVLIASAGNEPSGRPVYPAAYNEVLSVSALDMKGRRWDQANYGEFVDIAAPGFAGMPTGSSGGEAGVYGGTSISSAYVARALSQYRARHPDASAAEVRAALIRSLTDAGPQGRDPYYGNGALDRQAMDRFLKTN